MPQPLLVVENLNDWKPYLPTASLVTAEEYLASSPRFSEAGTAVINLCRTYKYQSISYYCSLLAEARNQRVLPSVKTISDISQKALYSLDVGELDHLLHDSLARQDSVPIPVEFSMDVYFGITDFTPLKELAHQLFETFRVPLLRVEFERRKHWHIAALKPQSLNNLEEHQQDLFASALEQFNNRVWPKRDTPKKYRCHLGILRNPQEALPPSNNEALERFQHIGKRMGIQVSMLEKKDFPRLCELDALFIRETTAVHHHTYRFAKKAESEGLVTIDDPSSILRCTNKVYLADVLRVNKLPCPRSYTLSKEQLDHLDWLEHEIGYPMVMKMPDGAFSRGVLKVRDREEFLQTARTLLQQSSLILVQEYLYTEFDWRIGVLNRKPIFACRYHMSRGHWQIARHDDAGHTQFGECESVALTDVPESLLQHAVSAANLIGDSLYGVDMKMTGQGPVVIEVNDNPNLDAGIEDRLLGDDLYRLVLDDFLRRIDRQHRRY